MRSSKTFTTGPKRLGRPSSDGPVKRPFNVMLDSRVADGLRAYGDGNLSADAVRWCGLVLRSQRSIEAENLFLRRQLALYVERGVKPRRMDTVTRISLAFLSRFFDWREALVVVRPETMIRWHRAGWKLLWRLKSRPGRPSIPIVGRGTHCQ